MLFSVGNMFVVYTIIMAVVKRKLQKKNGDVYILSMWIKIYIPIILAYYICGIIKIFYESFILPLIPLGVLIIGIIYGIHHIFKYLDSREVLRKLDK